MDGHSSRPGLGLGTEHLLGASEYFLRHRNFDGCRKYALKAQESDPHNAKAGAATQLLAVADVLSVSEANINNQQPDWYAILRLNRYSQDSQLIRNQFKKLVLLLNPKKNKFAFAHDAFELVLDAWDVLSNPSKKSQFDNELKTFESQSELKQEENEEFLKRTKKEEKMGGNGGSGDDTFWTVCPYCYYVYEYPRVYEECCLRCQNQNCRRGFHAVVIPSPPPPEVAANGQYWCFGFFPLGFDGAEGKGYSSWMPFAPMFMGTPQVEVKEKNAVPEGPNVTNTNSFIEISDNSDDSCDEFGSKKRGTFMNGGTKKVQTGEVKKGDESNHGCATESVQTEVPNVAKLALKRRKSVAKNTKKVMGKGTRIMKHVTVPPQSIERLDLNVEASKDDVDFGSGFGDRLEMRSGGDFVMGGVEFFEGDGDIFVGLQDGF